MDWNEIAEMWSGLSPELMASLAGVIAGWIIYVLQKWWTECPLLPILGKNTSNARKRLAAIVLAVVAAGLTGNGDWQATVTALVAALGASQFAFLWTKPVDADDMDGEM